MVRLVKKLSWFNNIESNEQKSRKRIKQLVKLGVPDETARLIAVSKHNPESDEAKALIEEHKEEQAEIQSFINDFKKIE